MIHAVLSLAGQQAPGIVADGTPVSLLVALQNRAADGIIRCVRPELRLAAAVIVREDRGGTHGPLEVLEGRRRLCRERGRERSVPQKVGQRGGDVGEPVDELPIVARQAEEAPDGVPRRGQGPVRNSCDLS